MKTRETLSRTDLFCVLSVAFYIFLSSCSVSKKIGQSAKENVLDAPALKTAHVGISIYEPATGKYLYNYQGDKYFVPASNTKLPTCYAAMKYLGDSLIGLRYGIPADRANKSIVIKATGDPSFLLPEFKKQPVFDFLSKKLVVEKLNAGLLLSDFSVERWGSGWSWNDYDQDYMAERSEFPVFGNIITVSLNDSASRVAIDSSGEQKIGRLLKTKSLYLDSIINSSPDEVTMKNAGAGKIKLIREIGSNEFRIGNADTKFAATSIPFVTNEGNTAMGILENLFNTGFNYVFPGGERNKYEWVSQNEALRSMTINKWNIIHSQPTDSLLKPMMHHSDNFFAEQSLLMVSNERLGTMSDEKIIDTLLKSDFKDLPQKPRWVDGSGLSRYNLFTPQDFVSILNKIKNEFGMERIKVILPTGGEGTLANYYKAESNYLFAKTGTLSGVVAFSGYLYTKKNKLLIFSILVNNHQSSATEVRRVVERFVEGIRNDY